jgi:hypothetical protein
MSFFDFTKPPIKEEGSSVTDSYKYKATNRYAPMTSNQLTILEGDRTIVVADMLLRLEYILQRTVPDYDELVKQFNAIRDIERCANEQG